VIINLNKLTSIKKMTFDLTDGRPFLYFLFQIDDDTPRYSRVNGRYIEDKNGSFIMDHGPNFFKQGPRTLVYIGQTKNSIARIYEHYWTGTKGKSKGKKNSTKKFNYVRFSKPLKMFEFDTIRQHYERIIVRKYLPFYNQASQFTVNQIRLILNSNGRIKPGELMKPYNLNVRDIFEAFKAWEIQDPNYLNNQCDKPTSKMRDLTGIKYPDKNIKNGLSYLNCHSKKFKFGRFVEDVLIPYHKKQRLAFREFKNKSRFFIKMFDKTRHKEQKIKTKVINKNRYARNKDFITDRQRKYRQAKKKINQPELF
jgi:hypothetical protein